MLFDGEISPTIEVDARTLGFDPRKGHGARQELPLVRAVMP